MAYDMYPDYDMLDEQYTYNDEEIVTDSVSELIEHCVKPTVLETYNKLIILFLVCLIFRILTHVPRHSNFLFQSCSFLCGVYIMYVFFGSKIIHTFGLTSASYIAIYVLSLLKKNHKGYIVGCLVLTYLFLAEFLIVNYDTWTTIRGSQMIASMKILSYAFDKDAGLIKESSVIDFYGYLFCPANCIFGPWVSYGDYMKLKLNDKLDIKWFQKLAYSLLLSVLFFVMSVCFLEWFIPEESNLIWLVYRNAMTFRVGHYFVSFVSEVTSILSGFGGKNWELVVTKPLSIELPYSLVQVVINWNIPMHKWLKMYIFKTTLHFGGFAAIMFTYLVSALLHGFNLRLAAVLLSLGVYTYVEYRFRKCLSIMFNACISSKPCPSNCKKHKRTTRNLIVHTVNVFFLLVALFHLAYLGVLMEVNNAKTKSLQETFKEWINLQFVSHWIVFATFVVYLIIQLLS